MLSYDLPALRTSRNRIVNAETEETVWLRGVNRSGLEYTPAGIPESDFDEIAHWGANVVRLPFNQRWALRSADYDSEAYLSALDQAIAMAARRGAYTILDLQWLDEIHPRGYLSNGTANFVPPLPNRGSIEVWSQLAARYRDETAVLYDLFNEPHHALPDDTGELNGIRSDGSLFALPGRQVTMAEWQPWARQLIAAIRDQNPNALIFVSGVDWGYDLEGFPLSGMRDIVYSAHVYPGKEKHWNRAFGDLARTLPVFIAEWGGYEKDVAWGRKLLRYVNRRKLGWTAWSWSDEPRLISSSVEYEATPFGELVRDHLRIAADKG